MAKMIPPYCYEGAPASERRVFQCLKEDPDTKEWTVLHSLGLARPVREIDFVVIIPREGIVCLEVKGGRVSCRDGVWRSTDRHTQEHSLKRSPFQQVQYAMFDLKHAIRNHFGEHAPESRCPVGCAVVFPDVVRELPPTSEFERSDVIYAQDLQPISASIQRLVSKRLRERQPNRRPLHPEPQEFKAIRGFLRPEFDRVPPLSARIERAEERLLSLTEEQYDRLDELEDNPRCLFEGAAGTGKTLLAVEYARRRARAGDRVLLVCYNRLLGAWLREQPREADVTVGTWHEALRQLICASGAAGEFLAREQGLLGRKTQGVLWDEVYPHHAKAALRERGEPPFDAVVVDEAQDLLARPEFLDLLNLAVRGGLAGGRWSMFGDFTRQALYGRDGGDGGRDPVAVLQAYGRQDDPWAADTRWWLRLAAKLWLRLAAKLRVYGRQDPDGGLQFARAKLLRNCRNTRSIAEATAAIARFETPPFRSGADAGIPVDYKFWGAQRPWQEVLAETLERLLKTDGAPARPVRPDRDAAPRAQGAPAEDGRVRAQDIVLLAPGRSERDTLSGLAQVAGQRIIECAPDVPADRPGIRVATIHAFKGLESPVVIIPGLDRDLDDWDPSLLYVGMSRARSLLVLIAHKKARAALKRRIGSQ